MANENALLVTAGLLGIAAYLFAENAQSAPSDGSTPVSGSNNNGFAINNPGNIKWSAANNWVGQTEQQNGFCVFDTLAHGVRALGILLTNYFNAGYTTIANMITHYEGGDTTNNDIPAYISAVSQSVGEDASAQLSWPQDEVSMIQAIVYHENGSNPMSDADVQGYIGS